MVSDDEDSSSSSCSSNDENKKKFYCPFCDKTFYSIINYEKHKKRHEPPGGFLCRYCDAPFCSEGELKQHRDTVHKTIICRLCPETTQKDFNNELDYREHIKVVHNGIDRKLFRCETCSGEFKTIGPYQRHVQYQCGKFKPFQCDKCPMTFATKYNLAQHIEKHSNIKKFCCSFCGKNFVQKGRLVEHERVHTGEKPYKCDICGKCFSHRESLVTHSTLHSGIRLVECRCCSSRFSCYSNLIKHRRVRPDTCGQPQYDQPKKTTRRISRIPATLNPTSEIRVIFSNKVIKPTDMIKVQQQKKQKTLSAGKAKSSTCVTESADKPMDEEKLESSLKKEGKSLASKRSVGRPKGLKNDVKEKPTKRTSERSVNSKKEKKEKIQHKDKKKENEKVVHETEKNVITPTTEPIAHIDIKIEDEENLFDEKDKILDSLLNETSAHNVVAKDKNAEETIDNNLNETEIVLIKNEPNESNIMEEEYLPLDKVEAILYTSLEEEKPKGEKQKEVGKNFKCKTKKKGAMKRGKNSHKTEEENEENSDDPLNLKEGIPTRNQSKRACKIKTAQQQEAMKCNEDTWTKNKDEEMFPIDKFEAALPLTLKHESTKIEKKEEEIEITTQKNEDTNLKENQVDHDFLNLKNEDKKSKIQNKRASSADLQSVENSWSSGHSNSSSIDENSTTEVNLMEEDNLTLDKLKIRLSSSALTAQEISKKSVNKSKNKKAKAEEKEEDDDDDDEQVKEEIIEDPLLPRKRVRKPPQKEKNLPCEFCKKIYHSQKPYEKHLRHKHQKNDDELKEIFAVLESIKEKEQKKQKDLKCHICGSVYLRKIVLLKHIEKHGKNGELKQKCPCRCGIYFATIDEATAHAQEVHRKDLYCALCDKFMKTKNSLRQHFRKNCPHLMDEDNGMERYHKFICDKCGKQFTSRTALNDHVRSDCGRWPSYECKICGKQLTTAGILRTHMLLHKDDTPFKCETCGKTFKVKAQYKEHMRFRHTDYKPFKCHLCTKAYPYRESLMIHMTVHTGMKRFACNFCGKRFTCISNLQAHRKVNADSCGQMPLDARPTLKMGVQKGSILYGGVPDVSFASPISNTVAQ